MSIVHLTDRDGNNNRLWDNLKKQANCTRHYSESMFSRSIQIIEYHGGNYNGSKFLDGHIVFDDEEQASLFVLKFS
jgi:hypothetical protein